MSAKQSYYLGQAGSNVEGTSRRQTHLPAAAAACTLGTVSDWHCNPILTTNDCYLEDILLLQFRMLPRRTTTT